MSSTNGKSAADIIRGAKLPTGSVEVCMHADLTAEHEAAERELEAALRAPRDSLAAGGEATAISERIKALEAEMREHTVTFRLRALPRPAWKRLVEAHPPRKSDDGELDERDKYIGVNAETFFTAMIRACSYEPELPDDVWELLFAEKLTDRQFDNLSDCAWRLNRRDVDVPFSPAASRLTEPSSPS